MNEVFLAVAVMCFALSACLAFLLLWISVGGFVGYWKIHLARELSYAKARESNETYRTIAMPALAGLSTGLIVSLSASFLYSGFTVPSNKTYAPVGAALFLLAGIVFLLLMAPALKGVSLDYFTSTPEQILAVSKELTGGELDAEETLRTLRSQLRDWEVCRGARSMGWFNKRGSESLNSAMQCVPADPALAMRDALEHVHKWDAFRAALRLSWWRFAWPFWVVTALNAACFLFLVISDKPLIGAALAVSVLEALSVVLSGLYALSELLRGARRLAQQKYCFDKCEAELKRADQRIAENGIRRLEGLIRGKTHQAPSADLRRIQLVVGANLVLTVVSSLFVLFVDARNGSSTLEK